MIDPNVPYRIQRIYSSSTEREKAYLKKILEEIADTGDSPTYRDIWLSDYKEIPVDIDTFLCDDYYLGKTTRNGEAIYPYWRKVFHEIFDNGNKYEECFFTGATRIGKSSTAVTCTAYMLYKLMCLRDPQQYFGKKDISKFSVLFFNLTKDLAKGVAFTEFQSTILSSPWFCLKGDTQILTTRGYQKIENIVGERVELYSYSDSGLQQVVPAAIEVTGYVDELIEIELEDGTIVSGTPNHQVLLSNGQYKRFSEITVEDDVMEIVDEIFQTVPGYDGMYLMSNLGRMKKIGGSNNQYTDRENIRKYNIHKRGYDSVDVSYRGKHRVENVPELVMKTFYPEYPSDRFYLEDDIHDNSVYNVHPGRRKLEGCWKDVPGTDGVVQVNDKGELYCHTYATSLLSYRHIIPEHYVNYLCDFDGYYYVAEAILVDNGYHFVHRIVASTFLGHEPSLVVNHKDGDKKNNSLENLEWCTVAENIEHARVNGLLSTGPRSVFETTTNTKFDTSTYAAKYFNISRSTVLKSVNNQTYTAEGLRFQYCES